MFENETRIARQQLWLLNQIAKDIDDAHYTQPVAGAKNPPAYVLCHLAMASDVLLGRLGKPKVCPAGWREAFGPGGGPERVTFPYPPKDEVLALIERGMLAACAAATEATPEYVAQPHGIPFLAESPIQTNGHFIALLRTAHIAMHIGQLSVMRRQLGFAPVF